MEKQKSLEVKNLKISFRTNAGKVQAVRDISFDLYRGETLAIVGESGSGKSVTSKAILGIQAANAIYEGGEILYDGQDLLKINEDDFYKLRGDKIAMIFQDPLSSLNPVMRIGKQLTEAMLLKGKARQKSCRESFDQKLDYLKEYMLAAMPERKDEVLKACGTFKGFELVHTRLEQEYNAAYDAAQEAVIEIRDLSFRLSKNAKEGYSSRVSKIKRLCRQSLSEFVVSGSDAQELRRLCAVSDPGIGRLDEMNSVLTRAVDRVKPDFSALGYVRYMQKEMSGSSEFSSDEENRSRLNSEFLNSFTQMVCEALRYSDQKDYKLRKEALESLKDLSYCLDGKSLDSKEVKAAVNSACDKVEACIEPLDIVKDSAACTFSGSLKDFYAVYKKGTRSNAPKQRKYDRQMAKYNALVAAGKEPDWKVAAPSVVDLDQVKHNMQVHTENLIGHFNEMDRLCSEDEIKRKAEKLLEYLKESVSGMVFKVTKSMSKQRALKLMAEVGIPEPEKRFRSYPFEFSGGMRQRIVIAIALAANPDVLICDEPTTALDVTIQAQILELINDLKKKRNLSIIFITHDLGVVANMADRIAVMYAGKIVEYGTADEIFYSPAHPYTWALLSSMPDLDTKEKLEAIPGTPPNMIYPPEGDAFAARNKYAMQIDFEQQPPRFDITDTHWAATWLLHPDAPKVEPPEIVTQRIQRMKKLNEERKLKSEVSVNE